MVAGSPEPPPGRCRAASRLPPPTPRPRLTWPQLTAAADAGPPVTPAPAAADSATPGHHHTRLIISIALLVVTLVATPLFLVSIWVHTVITDTDRYVHTVGPLADDPAVQEYVASQLSDAFKENVDVKAIVAERLPSSLQPLNGTITSAVERLRRRGRQPLHRQPGLQDPVGRCQPRRGQDDLQGADR